MISKVLSPSFEYLDSANVKKDRKVLDDSKKSLYSNWPDLKGALFEYNE